MINIVDFILLGVVTCFAVTGLFAAFQDGMLFEDISAFLRKRVPNFILKPLCACLFCMGGFYAQFIWFAYVIYVGEKSFMVCLQGALFCFFVCGLMSIPFYLIAADDSDDSKDSEAI